MKLFPFAILWCSLALFPSGAAPLSANQHPAPSLQQAVDAAMRQSPGDALLLDLSSGRTLARHHAGATSADRASTPGSTLKPFFLLAALRTGALSPTHTVYCNRNLQIAAHQLHCVHPPIAHALDAGEALAWSCNTYFAELARNLYATRGPAYLAQVLRARSLNAATPHSVAAAQLLVLGVQNITVTPAALAAAYRALALEITRPNATPAEHAVADALEDAVRYGSASAAATPGLTIAGKTGTAPAANGSPATHGWFVGYAPADHPALLVLVRVDRGRGADAAACAGQIFAAWQSGAR